MAHAKTKITVMKWANSFMTDIFTLQIAALGKRDTGLHFTAKKTKEERLREFDMTSWDWKCEGLSNSPENSGFQICQPLYRLLGTLGLFVVCKYCDMFVNYDFFGQSPLQAVRECWF
jgi:hypothetical protein